MRSWPFWVVSLAASRDASWVTVVVVAAAAAVLGRHVVGRTVRVSAVSVGIVRVEVQLKAA